MSDSGASGQDAAAGRTTPDGRPDEEINWDLPAPDVTALIRKRIRSSQTYARNRRKEWKTFATVNQIGVWALAATATVSLGLAELDGLAAVGFVCSALVTIAASVEPFFNWRSRWVMADEALAEWYALKDELLMLAATSSPSRVQVESLSMIEERRQAVWDRFSRQWLASRRATSNEGLPR